MKKVFDQAEVENNGDALEKIFNIIQTLSKTIHPILLIPLVFWGDMDLIEILLSNERYQLTFGAFECTPQTHFLINFHR